MLSPEEIPHPTMDHDLPERRQVTVLFADIVDYTGLALRFDPEDLRELLQRYYALAKNEIEASGGIVAEYLADGIVAHFGVPIAYQDAADRAVQAGKHIVRKAGEICGMDYRLSVRVGVATGLVVAEFDGINSKITGASGVLAARLQASAEPGSVYISDLTRRLLRRETEAHFVGDIALKGFSKPEPVWRLDLEDTKRLAGDGFPFFGRAAELSKLALAWDTVLKTGRATPLSILSGRPGIGKSRILREHGLHCPTGQKSIVLQAAERQSNTALYPVVEWLKLDDRVSLGTDDAEYLRALCQPETAMGLHLREAPGAIRQGTFDALCASFRRIAKAGPIQIIIEDLQWLDPSTLQLIVRLLTDLEDCPIQWLASGRPEFADSPVKLQSLVLNIGELSSAECHEAVSSCGGEGITSVLADEIVGKSEGVPLFLEHLLRELNEGRISGRETVPETLVGALVAWIDSTGSARRIAQCASVVGRHFDEAMLGQVSGLSHQDLNADIERLCKAEIFQRENASFLSFRHDLIRDAAYSTLLRKRRESLHRRVAWVHMQGNPHVGDKAMAEIAYHHEAAGDYTLAAEYRHRIGRYTTALGAFAEGESQLRHALDLLVRAERNGVDVEHRQANLLIDLAANLMQTRGFTGREVLETYMKSLAHLEKINRVGGDSLSIFWGIFTYQVLIGHTKDAAMTVSRMEAVLRRLPERERLSEHTLSVLGTRNGIQFYSGQFHAQLATLEKIKAHYKFEFHAPLAAKYGMDLFATAHAFSPHSAAIAGQFARARDLVIEADAHQSVLDIPLMLPFIDIWGGVALGYLGDFDLALARMERGIALADRQGAAFWSATGRMWQAVTEFEATGNPSSRSRMEQALAVQKLMGVGIGIPYWSAKLAAAYAMNGDDQRALEYSREALAGSPGTSEGVWRAERQRLSGFVHERAGRVDKALSFYNLAARTASKQSAVLWELRARKAIANLAPRDELNHLRLTMLSREIGPADAREDQAAISAMV
ncbi:AAA family ATPase [Rhizobium multihospitium]|uniref:AAA ATPase domain-containing protein n=1 Tax=Rhizobium multihospitium TaxID=410764 RepID=A0A1C3U241_9HYPH|nr:AAA family ATPase [Rhizobium multihospitium]SCB09524.1 AAA ATPase domain-containing protein [Rhizobium multihospitium]